VTSRFPLLLSGGLAKMALRQNPDWMTSVPLGFARAHRRRIEDDHGMSLDKLAAHGGLTPQQLLAAVEGQGPKAHAATPIETVMLALGGHLVEWHKAEEVRIAADAAAKLAATEPKPEG